jgi:hypothetical protein
MPRRIALSSKKASSQPVSRDLHDRRGPSSGSKKYKRERRALQRHRARSGSEPIKETIPACKDDADLLLSLSQQADDKLADADLAAAVSADDRKLLEAAVRRILRPHQPASGQAGGLQRSSSGNKAVTDLLDMLRKLGQQLQQVKQEAEEKIEGARLDQRARVVAVRRGMSTWRL